MRHLGSEVGITSAEASEPVTLAETSLSIIKTEGSPSDLSSPMSPRDDTGYEMVVRAKRRLESVCVHACARVCVLWT